MYGLLTKQQLLKRLFSNAGMYSVGILFTRVGGLLLLPIYWLKLDPTDFGVIGLAQIVTILLGPILSLGLYDAVQRLFFEWKAEERPRFLAALWTASIVFSVLVCVALHTLGAPLFAMVISQVPFSPYIEITIWTAFAANLGLFPLTLLRVREELRKFTLVTITFFLTQSLLILGFVYELEMEAFGYLLGILLNGILWGGYYIWFMTREIKLPFRFVDLVEPLRYSLPTIPASILEGIGSIFDRVFLDKYASLKMIGLYNLGNQFGFALNSFNQIMKASWMPLIFRVVSDRSDGPAILSRLSLYYIAAMAFPALTISLLSKELIDLFGNERYVGIYPFVPFFVLIYFLQAIGTAMGRGIDLAKKTAFSPIVPTVTIIANFVSMWFLVPQYGVWGAIIAFLITTVLRIGTHIGVALYFYPRPVYPFCLISLFTLVLLTHALGAKINTGNLAADAGLKVCAIMLGMVAIIGTVLGRNIIQLGAEQ